MKNSHLGQAWLVLTLALVFGGVLEGLQLKLQPIIEANKLNETLGKIPDLVSGAREGKLEDRVEVDGRAVYRAMAPDGGQLGWVIPAHGPGFADEIEVLIGVNRDVSQVTGLYVLAQKETPGLGNQIVEDQWRANFIGKGTMLKLEVTKAVPDPGGPQVAAITGATISSEAVTSIVNNALDRLRGPLAGAVKE